MKTPTMRHETEAFTINEILDIYPKLQWFTDNNYEQKADACTLRETIIEMARNKYHAPQHAIANVSTGDGGVLVELFWLEAQE